MKALRYADNSGKPQEEELSGDLKTRAEDARVKLCEAVAETDDALLEKYLDKGELEEGNCAPRCTPPCWQASSRRCYAVRAPRISVSARCSTRS